MQGDGDGWVDDADGHRRWGRHGAAGLLLRAPGADGPVVLLQHRAGWSHHGGTWGVPGGARDSHESAVQAALREAEEEAGIAAADVTVRVVLVTAGGVGWTYTTVVADAPAALALTANAESAELRWVREADVPALPLHPSFALSWPALTATPLRLLVDTANVLGSRPDGWWRDRAGSTTALLERLGALVGRTVRLGERSFGWVRTVDAVVEGVARDVRSESVTLHRAAGSGDDELVRHARAGDVVVTADRGLRERLPEGVRVVGPSTLLGWVDGTVDRSTEIESWTTEL